MMNKLISPATRILILLSLLLPSCAKHSPADILREGFINPPDSARPGVYWYFMDGNLNREAMTADLESMKKAGIGYVLFLEVNVGVPRGKIDFLSEEWQELYLHAVREAERLGIRIILGSGPGWAGSGGPWVNPEQSMSHLVASDTVLTGPVKFRGFLPVPPPKRPYFGESSLTPGLKKLWNDWYQDVVVLAFPYDGKIPVINDIDEKALYYRAPFTSVPGTKPYLLSHAEYMDQETGIDQKSIIDLTGRLQKDGTLSWNVPEGRWTVLRFVRRNNGAVTRPAPEPGLGFECDKFDTVSFDAHYNAYVGKLIEKVKPVKVKSGGGWTMIHIDSWEMGAQNWSPQFRAEFLKRRGYDPVPFLPVYTGLIVGNRELSERFLWDLRQTSNELIIENHAGRFKELGRRNGLRLSVEPYDMNPSADLDLGGVADIPMCEFWSDGYGFNSSFSCFEATSIAHVAGLPVVGAEAFTAGGNEGWKQYPERVKNQGDWAFCSGINRFVYHTFAHKPLPEQYRPGMTMGPYGVHWDRGQTWWNMAEGYHKYITRCQYLLSQGTTVADILYLTPEGAPQVFLPPASALDGTAVMPDKKGYSFDGCSPLFLIKNASVKDGKIVFPGGGSYRVLVLPETETMTPPLASKIESLINDGATVIGNPPVKSPSLAGYPVCDSIVKMTAAKIWGNAKITEELASASYGRGKIFSGKILHHPENDSLGLYPAYDIVSGILAEAGIRQDFTSSGNVRYIHHTFPGMDIYFVSNRTGQAIDETCFFRSGSEESELWNPLNAEINRIKTNAKDDGSTANLHFEPFQSWFIVFYHGDMKGSAERFVNFSGKNNIMTLNGPWNVKFDTAWGGPGNIVFDELSDWSADSNEGIRYYSGTAAYIKTFNLPENTDRKKKYFIDLGKVRNMARVKLNGRDLGILWTAPWQFEITNAVKSSGNKLEIEVVNLWINRLIGDESQPWDGIKGGKWPEWLLNGTQRPTRRYTFTTHRFYTKDDPLSESGLIGPVVIMTDNENDSE